MTMRTDSNYLFVASKTLPILKRTNIVSSFDQTSYIERECKLCKARSLHMIHTNTKSSGVQLGLGKRHFILEDGSLWGKKSPRVIFGDRCDYLVSMISYRPAQIEQFPGSRMLRLSASIDVKPITRQKKKKTNSLKLETRNDRTKANVIV